MEHTKPEGIAVINLLSDLGSALGYSVQPEHLVGKSAAVDLSWTVADSNDIPLFVFEVESSASAGLANNVTKVYGSPSLDPPRPLFFFHLVLKGSKGNERIENAQRMWGQHNYRVYRFQDANERSALALDIVKQHRRISRYIDLIALAETLGDPLWGGRSTAQKVLNLVEKLKFDAPYLHAYANLALRDSSYFILFISRLRHLEELAMLGTEDFSHLSREGYEGGLGDYMPGLMQIALRIFSGEISDQDGPAKFEQWARSDRVFPRMIHTFFGLSRDYDWYVIAVAPIQYSLAIRLLCSHPYSRDWVIQDFSGILASNSWQNLHPRYRLPGITWLALNLLSTYVTPGQLGTALNIESLYRALQVHVLAAKGTPRSLLSDPPDAAGDISDEPYWWNLPDNVQLPSLRKFSDVKSEYISETTSNDEWQIAALCLCSLINTEPYTSSGKRQLIESILSEELLIHFGEIAPPIGSISDTQP